MGFLVVEHGNRLSETYKDIDDLTEHLQEHHQLTEHGLVFRIFHDNQGSQHMLKGWEIELTEEQALLLKIQYPLIVGYLA